ncbi:kinase subunit of RNA polymerase II carboxy-terminal domain kinase I, partial [Rhizophlyctis rosea]
MVLEFLRGDLQGFLRLKESKLEVRHIKLLARQMFEGLDYLHSNNVIHRDMKGANLLITERGELKIADFGLAREKDGREGYQYTNRVVTMWYRCPELLLGSTRYGGEIDVWSAGCILAEMYLHTALFPGTDELTQLTAVVSILGPPPASALPTLMKYEWYQFLNPNQCYPRVFERVMSDAKFVPECWREAQSHPARTAVE